VSARGPVRTCVGCAARAPQATLVRLVAREGRLAVDLRRRASGRGAYLHREATCWTAFVARRGPVRSLRCSPAREERQQLVEALADTLQAGRPR
jgi:predicted RNA-binding protein YlxR (DUF448 family)